MLSVVRIEVERSRVRHVAAGFIGNDGDVVAYLALVRIAFEWIKRIAHRHVRRPRHASVGAEGIEQLRVRVVRSIARVIPDSIEPTIWRYRKRAEPVPLARVNRIVIDLDRRTKGCSVIGAAHKHHVGCASPWRRYAGQHVNVVVGRAARVINRQEQHSIQSCGIDSATRELAAQINLRYLVEDRCLIAELRIARAHTIKRAESFAADKEVPIGVHVECSICGRIRNNDREPAR